MLAKLQPDIALKNLLDGRVQAKTANREIVTLRVFAEGERGDKDADDEYIEVRYNGKPDDVTTDHTLWEGKLVVRLQCRMYSDFSANRIKMSLIFEQIEALIHRKCSNGYFFKFAPQPITPIQRDYTSGYAWIAFDVAWRYNYLSIKK